MRTTILGRVAIAATLAITSVAAISSVTASPPASAANPTAEPSRQAAYRWIEAELAANGGRMPSSFDPTGPDWGLTLDSVIALTLGGRGTQTGATTAMGLFEPKIGDYITGEAFGDAGSLYVGALGKSMYTAHLQAKNINAFGGRDLEALSRGAIKMTGPDIGRFSDLSGFGDFSNGFGQAFNVMALARTPGGVPQNALAFLLAQQCPGGGFRLTYAPSGGCMSDSQATSDITGLSLTALSALPKAAVVDAAIAKASAWLVSVQDPSGGFSSSGPALNSNSTGLAGEGLRRVGFADAANRAASFIASVQFDLADVASTPASAEVGAIAANSGSFATALASGVALNQRDQLRRSTAQAVLAIGPTFAGVQPARVLDTRVGASTVDGQQVGSGRVAAGSKIVVQVSGRGGVPVGAAAAVLNLTAVGGSGAGFVTAYPCDAAVPTASSVNFVDGVAAPNAVVMKLSATGTVCLSVFQESVDLIVDVTGYLV